MYIVIAAVVLLLAYWFKWRWQLMTKLRLNGIPGPPPNLILGNLVEFSKEDNVLCHEKWLKQYGKIFGYYLGGRPSVVVADLELIKRIQIKDAHLFTARSNHVKGGFSPSKYSKAIFAFQSGTEWKDTRTLLRPCFSSRNLKSAVPLMNNAIDTLLKTIEGKKETEFDIYLLFQGLTMDVIGRSAFGILTDAQNNLEDPFLLAVKSLFDIKFSEPLVALNLLFPEFTPILYPIRYSLETISRFFNMSKRGLVHKYCEQIVKARRHNVSAISEPWQKHDLLQQMIEADMDWDEIKNIKQEQLVEGLESSDKIEVKSKSASKSSKVLNNQEIVGAAEFFFEAGYETTSTALAYIAHILVNHQDVQDRIREEINELFEKDGKFDYNVLTGLQYLEAVICETMRLYPPVTLFTSRRSQVDYEYGDIVIPRDTNIVIPTYQLHHDPEIWEKPDEFNPLRFYGLNKGRANNIEFQAFGGGPRNCMGIRFAMLEAKLAIARTLHKFKLIPGPQTELGDIQLEYKIITMTPKNGIRVIVAPVD